MLCNIGHYPLGRRHGRQPLASAQIAETVACASALYPRPMARKRSDVQGPGSTNPSAPPAAAAASADAGRAAQTATPGAREGSAPGGGERFGPLLLERLVKDDGRALIVFTYAPQPDDGGARGSTA
jgi:hypothetical protein